jgi:5-methylcytosine-specific restriction endonuclease McrA
VFRSRPQRTRAELEAAYDAERGGARQRGYGARWDKVSAGFKRAHPLCLGCEAIGQVRATDVTDHVEPHKGDMVLFWNSEQWQPACQWHHDVIKQQLEGLFSRGMLAVADLWLDSTIAVRLTLELIERRGAGG